MKIKSFMEFLNKEPDDSPVEREISDHGDRYSAPSQHEKVVYIENSRLETVREQAENKRLITGNTQWADQSMGEILVNLGKLSSEDIDKIITYQRAKGRYFGEAAVELNLVSQEHILQALSIQFGYTYDPDEEKLSKEMVMAYSPFDEQAEEFRAIRSRLLSNWLTPQSKTLAIVSPEAKAGRSYVAANLALAFSQLGRHTLLIDADLRNPRQHKIFNFTRKIGFSMMLAGRARIEDLDTLPDQISSFQHLSILGCGAPPPNPAELLSRDVYPRILRKLEKYYDAIIIDTPPARYQADVSAIAAGAGSALIVTRECQTRISETNDLLSLLKQVGANVVGAVLNRY